MSDAICDNCRFLEPNQSNTYAGRCQRYAPRPRNQQGGEYRAEWPVVFSDDWCGDFQPKKIHLTNPTTEASVMDG